MFCMDRAHWLYDLVFRLDSLLLAALVGLVVGVCMSAWLRTGARRALVRMRAGRAERRKGGVA